MRRFPGETERDFALRRLVIFLARALQVICTVALALLVWWLALPFFVGRP